MSKYKIIDVEPTENDAPYKRIIADDIDPTEYSREEYDKELKRRGVTIESFDTKRAD